LMQVIVKFTIFHIDM